MLFQYVYLCGTDHLYGSLQLIRGSLDQVSGTADITWVQPRVLEGSQLDLLAQQFTTWQDAVGKTGLEVEEQRARANEAVAAA